MLFFLLAGCAPQVYYFPAVTGGAETYQKSQPQPEAVGKPLSYPDAQAGITPLAGLRETALLATPVPVPAGALAAQLSGPQSGSQPSGGEPGSWSPGTKEVTGQAYKLPDKEKKIRKLGKAGFILSLIGAGTLLLGLALPAVLYISFMAAIMGAVLSITALTDRKKAPKDYQDRWKAIMGLILGLIITFLSIIAIFTRIPWYS